MKKNHNNSDSNLLLKLGLLVSHMGGGGDKGAIFPQSDVDDLANGATSIPDQVTDARREGKKVIFVQKGGESCWYWQLPGGTKIYHDTGDH